MGKVIGPIHWSSEDRLATWRMIRELRESVDYMEKKDPERFRGSIDKEKTYEREQFYSYTGTAA